MLCLFAIFNFWRAIFYSWTTTLFWTWILFSCLFCFHSYLLFSLYFYYLQFDFYYAKFVEKNNKQFVNSIGNVLALYYCTFLFMGSFDFARNDSTPACAGRGCPRWQLVLRTLRMSCTLKIPTLYEKNNNSYINNQDRKADRAGQHPLTKCVLYLFKCIVYSCLGDSSVSLTLHSEWHLKKRVALSGV